MACTYNFQDHKKGDTMNAIVFTITRDASPEDLTGASIKMKLRELNVRGDVAATYEVGTGFTLSDPSNGEMTFDKQVIDLTAMKYVHDIEVTLASGDIYTWIKGEWTITQDVS
jgi:hypothetical protein